MKLGSKFDKKFSTYDIRDIYSNFENLKRVFLDIEFEDIDFKGIN